MLTEAEILAQHRDQLKIAGERCVYLQRNMVEVMPRGVAYADLRDAIRKLEGTSRQMFHWRGDDARWVRLAAMYARAEKLAARLLISENWAGFGDLAELFEKGRRYCLDLAERPTGRSLDKLILPGDISPWYRERHPRVWQ